MGGSILRSIAMGGSSSWGESRELVEGNMRGKEMLMSKQSTSRRATCNVGWVQYPNKDCKRVAWGILIWVHFATHTVLNVQSPVMKPFASN